MAIALLGLSASLNAPLAHADSAPDSASIAAQDAAHAGDRPPPSAADAAIEQAKSSGKSVEIPSLTTEFSETVATPDGHLQESRKVDPQRLKRDGNWIPLDATLAGNPDGSFSPKAASSGLTLSGGGTGPLATMTNPGGQQLSITAPFTLPAPTTTANSALYPNVAPDTDLKVTVTNEGGFSTVLVVKTSAAAANPALRKLHWPATAKGVKLNADSSGNISAMDNATGRPVFAAPTPIMWDSSTSSPQAPAKAQARTQSLRSSVSNTGLTALADTAAAPTGTEPISSASGPGVNAVVAAMPATTSAGGIDLTPSQDILANPATAYPVYIDPSWLSANPSLQDWAWVQSAYPTRTANGGTPGVDTNHLGVGFCGYYAAGGSCSPTTAERTFYQFNTQAWHGAVINSAVLHISEYESANWDCATTYPVNAYVFPGIDANTNWSNQPQGGTYLDGRQVGGSGGSGCHDNVDVPLNVTNAMTSAANGNWDIMDIGIQGDESDPNGLKYFNASPTLVVTYDKYPDVPKSLHTGPATPRTVSPGGTTTDIESCDSRPVSNYGWITTNSVQLQSTLTSTAQGQLTEWANIWDNTNGGKQVASGWSGWVTNGNVASFQLPAGSLQDGHVYGWEALSGDGLVSSAKTGVCHFSVDLSAPTMSLKTMADKVDTTNQYPQFPPSGNSQATTVHVGSYGYIPFSATDQSPGAGLVASGVAAVRWSYDPNPPADWGWVSPDYLSTASGSPVSIVTTGLPVNPTHWGTNVIYIQVKDRAGNITQETPYSFYVPWSPTPLAYGDVSGDGRPDVLAPDPITGDLLDYSQAITFNAPAAVPGIAGAPNAPRRAATALQAPDQKSWNNFRVSHRGTKNALGNVDDLFAHQDPSSPTASDGGSLLYYLTNNSTQNGTFDLGKSDLARPLCVTTSTTNCADYGDPGSWSTVSQITPIGSDSTTLTPTGTPTKATGILALENGNLWYYPAGNGNSLGGQKRLTYFTSPVELTNDKSWGNYDLMVPGFTLNTATPALWVRARADIGTSIHAGDIYQYSLTFGSATDSNGTYTTLTGITPSPATRIGNGITVAAFPLVGASGDLTGNNIPDLWARSSATGQITTWGGITVVDPATKKSYVGGFTPRTDQWLLTPSTKTDDASHANVVSPTGGTTSWSSDAPPGAAGSARLDGGILPASWGAFDTTGAYSVSTWVKLDNLNSYQTFVSQAGANMGSFYLQYNKYLNAWAFLTTASDNVGAAQYIAHSDPSALLVQPGQWTHLVGTYDASGTLTLYVNGRYAGSAGVSAGGTWPTSSTGPLTIGGVKTTGGAISNQTTGNIADVRIYPYTLTKEQVTTIYKNL